MQQYRDYKDQNQGSHGKENQCTKNKQKLELLRGRMGRGNSIDNDTILSMVIATPAALSNDAFDFDFSETCLDYYSPMLQDHYLGNTERLHDSCSKMID